MLTFVEQRSLDRETTSGLVVRSEATKLSNVISVFPTLCLNIKGVTGKKVHSQILGLAELKYYRVLCCSTFHNPKNPWRRKWQPTPIFLPEKSQEGAWWATVYGVAKESDLAVIQQQYTNVHCELPKEVSEYGLSHIYLTIESGFFFFFQCLHSHEQCFLGHISVNTALLVTREQRRLDHPICLHVDHFDFKVSWAVVQ